MSSHTRRRATLRLSGQSIEEALRYDGQAAIIHVNIGLMHLDAGRYVEAIGCFRTALRSEPNQSKLHCHLGDALWVNQDRASAMAAYEQALNCDANTFTH